MAINDKVTAELRTIEADIGYANLLKIKAHLSDYIDNHMVHIRDGVSRYTGRLDYLIKYHQIHGYIAAKSAQGLFLRRGNHKVKK